jgi:hypothetical protein
MIIKKIWRQKSENKNYKNPGTKILKIREQIVTKIREQKLQKFGK